MPKYKSLSKDSLLIQLELQQEIYDKLEADTQKALNKLNRIKKVLGIYKDDSEKIMQTKIENNKKIICSKDFTIDLD